MGMKGINVRETGTGILFRALLEDSTGAVLSTGTTELRLFELQSDGSLEWYDFNDNTFKATQPTDDEVEMTHQTYIDDAGASQDSGLWTYVLSTITGFTEGNIYIAHITNSGALPIVQGREFMYGAGELSDTLRMKGDAQTITDLKDLADSGYDPTTHKLSGVVLVDTTTTNTDMRGTDNAATAADQTLVKAVTDKLDTMIEEV